MKHTFLLFALFYLLTGCNHISDSVRLSDNKCLRFVSWQQVPGSSQEFANSTEVDCASGWQGELWFKVNNQFDGDTIYFSLPISDPHIVYMQWNTSGSTTPPFDRQRHEFRPILDYGLPTNQSSQPAVLVQNVPLNPNAYWDEVTNGLPQRNFKTPIGRLCPVPIGVAGTPASGPLCNITSQ